MTFSNSRFKIYYGYCYIRVKDLHTGEISEIILKNMDEFREKRQFFTAALIKLLTFDKICDILR